VPLQVVLDTNVLVAAFRSRRGASFALLARLAEPAPGYELHVSVPLVFEYEAVLQRQAPALGVPQQVVEDVLDFVCAVAHRREVFFLWRPALRDAGDDMVLELAVAAGADYVVTFNARDFAGAERFGVRVIGPRELLRQLENAEGGR
jgi:putative PIN family toxin of toxin-antitoxin system